MWWRKNHGSLTQSATFLSFSTLPLAKCSGVPFGREFLIFRISSKKTCWFDNYNAFHNLRIKEFQLSSTIIGKTSFLISILETTSATWLRMPDFLTLYSQVGPKKLFPSTIFHMFLAPFLSFTLVAYWRNKNLSTYQKSKFVKMKFIINMNTIFLQSNFFTEFVDISLNAGLNCKLFHFFLSEVIMERILWTHLQRFFFLSLKDNPSPLIWSTNCTKNPKMHQGESTGKIEP